MPVRQIGSNYQCGKTGKVYSNYHDAARQCIAIHLSKLKGGVHAYEDKTNTRQVQARRFVNFCLAQSSK